MTEQSPSPIGTVAQEAARLIEDMATMARLSHSRASAPSRYAGGPAGESAPMGAPGKASSAPDRQAQQSQAQQSQAREKQAQDGGPHDSGTTDEGSAGACSQCGAERNEAFGVGAANCRLCPLCRGIGLLRSVRPETVDLLADLAMSVAAGLREVALWSRASDPAAAAKSAPASSPESDRAPVQDIPVDDEGEG